MLREKKLELYLKICRFVNVLQDVTKKLLIKTTWGRKKACHFTERSQQAVKAKITKLYKTFFFVKKTSSKKK